MKKKYIVQTLVTFVEYHIVEANNEREAELIALDSDYNTSIHIGTKPLMINEVVDEKRDIANIRKKDPYFFQGYATIDDEGYLTYMKMDGTVNGNMPKTKINIEN